MSERLPIFESVFPIITLASPATLRNSNLGNSSLTWRSRTEHRPSSLSDILNRVRDMPLRISACGKMGKGCGGESVTDCLDRHLEAPAWGLICWCCQGTVNEPMFDKTPQGVLGAECNEAIRGPWPEDENTPKRVFAIPPCARQATSINRKSSSVCSPQIEAGGYQ